MPSWIECVGRVRAALSLAVPLVRALAGTGRRREVEEALEKLKGAARLLDEALDRKNKSPGAPEFLDHGLPKWAHYDLENGYLVRRKEEESQILSHLLAYDRGWLERRSKGFRAPIVAIVGDSAAGKTVLACQVGISLRQMPGRPVLHVQLEKLPAGGISQLADAVRKVAKWSFWAPVRFVGPLALLLWFLSATLTTWEFMPLSTPSAFIWAGTVPVALWCVLTLVEALAPKRFSRWSPRGFLFWPWRPVVIIEDLHRDWQRWAELRRKYIKSANWPALVIVTARGALTEHRVGPQEAMQPDLEEASPPGLRKLPRAERVEFIDEKKLWPKRAEEYSILALTRQMYEQVAPKLVERVLGHTEGRELREKRRRLVWEARCNLLALYHLLRALKEEPKEDPRPELFEQLAHYLASLGEPTNPRLALPVVVVAAIYRFEEVPVHQRFVEELLQGSVEGFPRLAEDSTKWLHEVAEIQHWLTRWAVGEGRWYGLPHAGVAELTAEMLELGPWTGDISKLVHGIAEGATEVRELGPRLREAYVRWLVARGGVDGPRARAIRATLQDLAYRVVPEWWHERDVVAEAIEPWAKKLAGTRADVLSEQMNSHSVEWRVAKILLDGWLGGAGRKRQLVKMSEKKEEPVLVRCATAVALARVGEHERAANLLLEMLTKEEVWLLERWNGAGALWVVPPDLVVCPLFGVFPGGSPDVRFLVANAFSRIAERAIEQCRGDLNNPSPGVRVEAAWVLGLIGSVEVLPDLIERLEDGDVWVRGTAAWALGRIGSAQVVPKLIERLDDENGVVRWAVAFALGAIASAEAVPVLVERLGDEDARVRIAAVGALGWIGCEKAVGPLVERIEDESEGVRGAVAWALGMVGCEKAVGPLVERLGDEDRGVRIAASLALGKIGEPALQPCIDALKSPNPDVREAAAEALRVIGSERAVGPLVERLEDDDQAVRWAAAGALGEIGGSRALQALWRRLGAEPDGRVREAMRRAIRRIERRRGER